MKLKSIPESIMIYGDINHRDAKCPLESVEQITYVSWVRKQYPDTHGITLYHAKNEGKLINGQFTAITKDRAMGMSKGACDIVVPGSPAFCMEVKRVDHTKSKISDEQIAYLLAAQQAGAFSCIALGHKAAIKAFNDWQKMLDK